MKDRFSAHADQYAQYRPAYPASFYAMLLPLVNQQVNAWDCGTGNGQVASVLATHFQNVYATDISANQLAHAVQHERIAYSQQPAEQTNFPDHFFDLIVVAQAIHWFDFGKFYAEVNRVLKPGGVLAVVGYNRPRVDPEVDACIDDFYTNVVGPYWDNERKYVDENYLTIPFPFKEEKFHGIENTYRWDLDHVLGYLGTWSAVRKYMQANENDPVEALRETLKKAWGNETTRKVRFPLLLRVGRK